MNSFLVFFIRTIVALPATMVIWLVGYLGLDFSFWQAVFLSIAGGAVAGLLSGEMLKSRFLKKHHLTRKEYQYIRENLQEAKPKIARLHKALFSIRHMPSTKKRVELSRTVRKIYKLTKSEPKRFYLAEPFYFSHLDTAVELAEKYVFLSGQPTKTVELNHSLYETRQTLEEMSAIVEEDLYHVISDDIYQLHFELDVAKHTIKKEKQKTKIEDESRRLK